MNCTYVDQFNKEVILLINPKIYNMYAAMISAHAFTNICWVYFDSDLNSQIVVYLKPKSMLNVHMELEHLGYEFFNYLLGVMRNEQ